MGTSKLDEMQLQTRNRIGTESFFLLCCLIIIDAILYGVGIRWLEYPVNTFFIMLLCLTYYSIGLLLRGAYVRTTTNKTKEIAKKATSSVISVLISSVIALVAIKSKLIKVAGTTKQNHDVKYLIAASVIILIILLAFMMVSKKKYEDDQE